jgi:hypothetical protein
MWFRPDRPSYRCFLWCLIVLTGCMACGSVAGALAMMLVLFLAGG